MRREKTIFDLIKIVKEKLGSLSKPNKTDSGAKIENNFKWLRDGRIKIHFKKGRHIRGVRLRIYTVVQIQNVN